MAQPIRLGLILDKEESERFQNYLDNPEHTFESRRLIRKAAKIVKRQHI